MAFFLKLKRNYLSKRRGLPHIFSLDTNSFKAHKNITVFESIRKTRVSRDAQNVCAITIVGTVLNKVFTIFPEVLSIMISLFHSLSAWRQVSETWLQKRSPSRNLGEHR